MENGLILLNTLEGQVYTETSWYFAGKTSSWLGIIIGALFLILSIVLIIKADGWDEELLVLGILGIGLSIAFVIGTLIHEEYKTYPKYQVTITETTNMREFYDKYDIIKQDGMIFTIRDKDYETRDYGLTE